MEQLFSYLATLGIGGVLGIALKSFFESKMAKNKMVFEARTRAYSGITGRIFNLFLEPDITGLQDDALIWAKLNGLLSEVYLLGSNELIDLVSEYQTQVWEFHKALDKNDDSEAERLHKELNALVEKIFDQMRRDVFISRKSAWGKPTKATQLLKR